ncbi:MAG TPA: PAS domain-containing sensor histidine kinase [Terriglobales bacterium]
MAEQDLNSERPSRPWPVVVAALLSLAITLVVWQIGRTLETNHIHRMTRLAALAVHEDLVRDTRSWIFDLVRLAKLWEFPQGPTYSEWKANAQLYLEHHPGCLGVEWLQPTYDERWPVRAPGEANEPLVSKEVRDLLLQEASATDEPVMSHPFLTRDGRVRYAVVVPIHRNQQIQGFVIAIADVKQTLTDMLSDVVGLGYFIVIREGGTEIYRPEGAIPQNEKQFGESVALPLPGDTWELFLWPKPETLGEMGTQTHLSTIIFAVGGLLGVMLTSVVHFAQKAANKSSRLEYANRRLAAGMEEQRRAEAALRASQTRFARILEISADAVVSVNQQLQITLFNQGAEKIFGYRQPEILGQSLDVLLPQRFRDIHRQHIGKFAESPQQTLIMSERQPLFGLRKDGTEFPLVASISRLDMEGEKIFTAILRDITEEERAKEELRRSHDELEGRVQERTAELTKLSNRMVHLQDQERRRIARELHDGTTQSLIALNMDLAAITKILPEPDPRVERKLSEAKQLVQRCMDEIRTVSYLLHPPLLDDVGLELALQTYVEGFSTRSGIQVNLQLLQGLGRLPKETEVAIFRIVQEGLANIHRHAQSSTASITLGLDAGDLRLEIADQGRGIPPAVLHGANGAGVGLPGMRERVRQLGGRCDIESGNGGTTIHIVLSAASLAEAALRD